MAFKLHQAHVQVGESEMRFRRPVEVAPYVVYTYTTKLDRIYYSPHAENLLRYLLYNLYAHPFYGMVHSY